MDLLCAIIAELIALDSTEVLKQSDQLFKGLIEYLAQQLLIKENLNEVDHPITHLLVKVAQYIQPEFNAKNVVEYCSNRIISADFNQFATLSGEKTIATLREYIVIVKVLTSMILGYKSTITFSVLEKLFSMPKIQIASADFTLVLSKFTKHIWKLTYSAIKTESFAGGETEKLFAIALTGLEINSYQSLYYVYQSLYELSVGSKVGRFVEELLQSAWASYYDCKRKSHKLTAAFLRLCFNEATLQQDTVEELLDKVLKLSEHSPRLSHLLVAHLCALFKNDITIANRYMKIVIELCLLPTDSSVENSGKVFPTIIFIFNQFNLFIIWKKLRIKNNRAKIFILIVVLSLW